MRILYLLIVTSLVYRLFPFYGKNNLRTISKWAFHPSPSFLTLVIFTRRSKKPSFLERKKLWETFYVYIEPCFFGVCEETKNIFFMCETETYTMFPHQYCSPSFFARGREWDDQAHFTVHFYFAGLEGLSNSEAINTSLFLFRVLKKKKSSLSLSFFSNTLRVHLHPLGNKKRLRHTVEWGSSWKPSDLLITCCVSINFFGKSVWLGSCVSSLFRWQKNEKILGKRK